MKKLINETDKILDEMLDGIAAAYPQYVERIEFTDVLVRANRKSGKVALVSGGGGGHEPAHGGYVGKGMLDAAVTGEMFTSPTPDQVLEAIHEVNAGAGILLITKNYTGDVMNFEMAAEMANDEGIEVEQVIVADDVAVEDSTWTTGRRGIAGTVFVHKIAGALAEKSEDLEDVKRVAEKVIANVRSMGMAVNACTVPAVGQPSFVLADNEMEIGIGIHGEPGVKREPIRPVNEIVDELLAKILAEDIYHEGDEVAVMVNGMGGTPYMELYIANKHLSEELAARGLRVVKTVVGNYMTSLEMEGFSISLLKLDEEMKELLLAPADTPAYVQV